MKVTNCFRLIRYQIAEMYPWSRNCGKKSSVL